MISRTLSVSDCHKTAHSVFHTGAERTEEIRDNFSVPARYETKKERSPITPPQLFDSVRYSAIRCKIGETAETENAPQTTV